MYHNLKWAFNRKYLLNKILILISRASGCKHLGREICSWSYKWLKSSCFNQMAEQSSTDWKISGSCLVWQWFESNSPSYKKKQSRFKYHNSFKWTKSAVLTMLIHLCPHSSKKKKKKTCSNLTSRKLQSNGPSDSTGKIKVWFMIWEEPHYSKREHFRRNSVTTDEMLPMFGHMVKYSPSKRGLTRLLGVCTHLCEVSVLKCVGIK